VARRLNELKPLGELPVEALAHADADKSIEDDDSIDAVDAVDPELFPIFEEEPKSCCRSSPPNCATGPASPTTRALARRACAPCTR
jgi:hypothetical protein